MADTVSRSWFEDGYLRNNISDNALKELKQSRNLFTENRKALTVQEQELFVNFLRNNPQYNHWYPIFTLMLGTGLRVGEAVGLRWEDVDFDNNQISINHTLSKYISLLQTAANDLKRFFVSVFFVSQ